MKDSKFVIRKLDAETYLFSPEHQSLGYKTGPIVILQITMLLVQLEQSYLTVLVM
jgi:hypothetical protein